MLPALADEGMWLLSLISSRIDDMRAKGFCPPPKTSIPSTKPR